MKEKRIHRLFVLSVGLKGFYALAEMASGIGLYLVAHDAIMNVVNFSDGIDGLAAGVCAISAAAFAVIAFDLHKDSAGVLALITAGAALGFLVHNFHPASVFMGDCGSNLLGLLLSLLWRRATRPGRGRGSRCGSRRCGGRRRRG